MPVVEPHPFSFSDPFSIQNDKSSTPGLKSNTPTPRNDAPTPGTSSTPGLRPMPGKPTGMDPLGGYRSPGCPAVPWCPLSAALPSVASARALHRGHSSLVGIQAFWGPNPARDRDASGGVVPVPGLG